MIMEIKKPLKLETSARIKKAVFRPFDFPYTLRIGGKLLSPDASGIYPYTTQKEEETLQYHASKGILVRTEE